MPDGGDAVGEIKFWKEMPEGPRKDAIYGSNNGKVYVENIRMPDNL